MSHSDFLMPLGAALSGTLPFPTLVKDEAGLVIAMQVFGRRVPAGGQASVLTTKGDLLTHDGASAIRLAVGDDNLELISDSAETKGVAWGVSNMSGTAEWLAWLAIMGWGN